MGHGLSGTLLNLFTTFGYAGIILAMAIESCCIPLPSELVMPLAGFLAYQNKLNLGGSALAGAVGCVVGSTVAYWIGATGGRALLLRNRLLHAPHADCPNFYLPSCRHCTHEFQEVLGVHLPWVASVVLCACLRGVQVRSALA